MGTDLVWHRIDRELTRRKDARLSPSKWADLARKLDTTNQVVHNWKTRGVPPKEFPSIAAALGWTVDQLIGQEEAPDLVVKEGPATYHVQIKTSQAIDADPREPELLAAFRFLPRQERDELYTHVMDRAKFYRDQVEQLMRDRFGVTGTASNTRVTESIQRGTGLLEPRADFGPTEPGTLTPRDAPAQPPSNYKLPKPISATPPDHRASKKRAAR